MMTFWPFCLFGRHCSNGVQQRAVHFQHHPVEKFWEATPAQGGFRQVLSAAQSCVMQIESTRQYYSFAQVWFRCAASLESYHRSDDLIPQHHCSRDKRSKERQKEWMMSDWQKRQEDWSRPVTEDLEQWMNRFHCGSSDYGVVGLQLLAGIVSFRRFRSGDGEQQMLHLTRSQSGIKEQIIYHKPTDN